MSSSKLHLSNRDVQGGGVPNRTLTVWESAYNASQLSKYSWNLQIAKSVATGSGDLTFNVIWQSKAIAPSIDVSWKTFYGLNWTTQVPASGLSVTLSGNWQNCGIGEIYDLDSNGFWVSSSATADNNYMNVGNVQYTYPGIDGIHIVVGILNAAGGFDPIYVDPTALARGTSAKYQPQESVMWWYQTGMRNSTMIEAAATAKGRIDFTGPARTTNDYHYWTTYNYKSGDWITSERAPNPSLYAPGKPGDNVQVIAPVYVVLPAFLQAIFQIAVTGGKASAAATLKTLLEVKYGDVQVKFIDDLHLKVHLGSIKQAKQYSNDSFAVAQDDAERDVSDCLTVVYDDNQLPNGETWAVQYASDY